MGLGNLLILTQTTVFVINFLLTFFVFIPITVNLAQFNGKCLLFAKGEWHTNDSAEPVLHVNWQNSGPCNLALFVGAFTMPLSLLYILILGVYLFKGTEPSWLAAFVKMIISCFCNVMTFSTSIVVTVGFHDWCNLVTDPAGDIGGSCDMAEFITFLEKDTADPQGFYMEYCMTIFGLWFSWICWMILTGCAIIQLCRYHQQEDFLISMSRERERLIQRVSRPNTQRI